MKLLIDDQINRDQWAGMIAVNPFASPFQTPEFYDLLNSADRCSASVFAVEEDGRIEALAVVALQKEAGLKRYFSRRGIIYGGPLLETQQKESADFLLKSISRRLSKKVIYLENRNYFNFNSYQNVFDSNGWKFVSYCNFQLDLSGKKLDDVLAGMSYNRRREIRLSLENGATYQRCTNEDQVTDLYSILAELYRTRVKLPLPPLKYFFAFLNSNICKIFIVKHGNNIIGGSFCHILPNHSIYTAYYCGFRDYHKRIFPAHLAVLAAIEYGIEHHFSLFDFMGAGKPGIPYGVRDYKKEFGGLFVEYGRFLNITQPVLYQIGKTVIALLSKVKR